MSKKQRKQQITEDLHAIGAGWALSDQMYRNENDPIEIVPCYHVRPDRNHADDTAIERFWSLAQIEKYIAIRRLVLTLSEEEAEKEWERFRHWLAIDTM